MLELDRVVRAVQRLEGASTGVECTHRRIRVDDLGCSYTRDGDIPAVATKGETTIPGEINMIPLSLFLGYFDRPQFVFGVQFKVSIVRVSQRG